MRNGRWWLAALFCCLVLVAWFAVPAALLTADGLPVGIRDARVQLALSITPLLVGAAFVMLFYEATRAGRAAVICTFSFLVVVMAAFAIERHLNMEACNRMRGGSEGLEPATVSYIIEQLIPRTGFPRGFREPASCDIVL